MSRRLPRWKAVQLLFPSGHKSAPDRPWHGRPAELADRVEDAEGGDAVAVPVAGQRDASRFPKLIGQSGDTLDLTVRLPRCYRGRDTATERTADPAAKGDPPMAVSSPVAGAAGCAVKDLK